MNEDHWISYFFERHSAVELRGWARRLRLFRFFRAIGGHANDGDSLDCALRYRSVAELEAFFSCAGLPLVRYDSESSQAEPAVTHSGEVYSSFPSLIPGTKWIRQAGHCEIAGNKAFVWCDGTIIFISATPGKYDVTDADVENARRIEAIVRNAALEVQDPPRDTRHYFCPKYFPEQFSGWRRWF
jgi:hypothetical protein